jgi:phosphoribosylformylglycinamidine cyclo-ligase
LVQGAEPLFFLDYFACGKLDVDIAASVIQGIASGCEQAGCALIGGETAEMPDMYPPGEYDLAGFAVGVVEKERIIDGRSIRAGDAIIGLASSGLHSNGYSLVRKIVAQHGNLAMDFHGQRLAATLMTPTRIYVRSILALLGELPVKALAHITGGGLLENVPRVLPDDLCAVMQRARWTMPPVFSWLQQAGNVAEHEMYRTFNCGIGMVAIVAAEHTGIALANLRSNGETAWLIGAVRVRHAHEAQAVVE